MGSWCVIGLAALAVSAGGVAAQDVLLIPDSEADSVWAFDAFDGSLLTNSYITDPGSAGGVDVFNRPIEVLLAQSGNLLVTDQFADVVSEFTPDGSFVGVFSLGGVRDTQLMDNIRGGHVLGSGPDAGDVLVCNAGGTNALLVSQSNVKRLDPADGSEQSDFAFNRYGGIRGPFDAIEYKGFLLVCDESADAIARYNLSGKFVDRFVSSFTVPDLEFPQQMAIASGGTLLVCEFSNGVIYEFAPDGTLVGQYDPGTLDLYRGIAELGNGNLLVTTTSGVFEVTRAGTVVETEAAGGGFRYVTPFTPPAGLRLAAPPRVDNRPVTDPRTREQIIAQERGEVVNQEDAR
ncbi:MAG: hypothetical protein AAGA55_04680 [Planctomycetota bacterium]